MDKGDVTRHFQVLGSLITSSAYMHSTLKNKEMDRDNARTLAVNQGLNFLLPTVAAYTVDLAIRQINKQLEYKYSAIQEAKNTALTGEAKKEAEKLLGKKLKGFRTLIGIVTFTLIYRFVAPVAITPIANAIGRWINGNNKNKEVLVRIAYSYEMAMQASQKAIIDELEDEGDALREELDAVFSQRILKQTISIIFFMI